MTKRSVSPISALDARGKGTEKRSQPSFKLVSLHHPVDGRNHPIMRLLLALFYSLLGLTLVGAAPMNSFSGTSTLQLANQPTSLLNTTARLVQSVSLILNQMLQSNPKLMHTLRWRSHFHDCLEKLTTLVIPVSSSSLQPAAWKGPSRNIGSQSPAPRPSFSFITSPACQFPRMKYT